MKLNLKNNRLTLILMFFLVLASFKVSTLQTINSSIVNDILSTKIANTSLNPASEFYNSRFVYLSTGNKLVYSYLNSSSVFVINTLDLDDFSIATYSTGVVYSSSFDSSIKISLPLIHIGNNEFIVIETIVDGFDTFLKSVFLYYNGATFISSPTYGSYSNKKLTQNYDTIGILSIIDNIGEKLIDSTYICNSRALAVVSIMKETGKLDGLIITNNYFYLKLNVTLLDNLPATSNIDTVYISINLPGNAYSSTFPSVDKFLVETARVFPFKLNMVILAYVDNNDLNIHYLDYITNTKTSRILSINSTANTISSVRMDFTYDNLSNKYILTIASIIKDLILINISFTDEMSVPSMSQVNLITLTGSPQVTFVKSIGNWTFIHMNNPNNILSYLNNNADLSLLTGNILNKIILTGPWNVLDMFILENSNFEGEIYPFILYFDFASTNIKVDSINKTSSNQCLTLINDINNDSTYNACVIQCPRNKIFNSLTDLSCNYCPVGQYAKNNQCVSTCSGNESPLGYCTDSSVIQHREFYSNYSFCDVTCPLGSGLIRDNFNSACTACQSDYMNDDADICIKPKIRYINPYTQVEEVCNYTPIEQPKFFSMIPSTRH